MPNVAPRFAPESIDGLTKLTYTSVCTHHIDFKQGSSERVRYFAERVLNVRSDQQIKNAFRTRSFRRMCIQTCLETIMNTVSLSVKLPQAQQRSQRDNR